MPIYAIPLPQMFNRFAAIILLVMLISSNFSHFFTYAGFELNHKYIAENLCVNKNRPWLHCNGKCYLMKKIKQAEDNEKKQQREDQKSRFQEALPASQAVVALKFEGLVIKTRFNHTLTPKTVQRYYSILLPPKVA